jgi:hypothetical protein
MDPHFIHGIRTLTGDGLFAAGFPNLPPLLPRRTSTMAPGME